MHVRPWSDALKPRVRELLMGKRFAKYSLLFSSWTVAIMVKEVLTSLEMVVENEKLFGSQPGLRGSP